MYLFYLARAWVLIGHTGALAFAVSVTMLHVYFVLEPYVGDQLKQLEPTIPSLYVPVIVAGVIVCVGHFILLVRALMHTVRVIHPSKLSVVPSSNPSIGPKSTGPAFLQAEESRGRWSRLRVRETQLKLAFLRFWVRYQAEITRLFILWEVALQTFQANKISQLVTRNWINRLITLVIVTNCWFSPVLHFFLGARPKAYIRLNRLLFDSSLDVAYSIVIPLTIFAPYHRDYVGGLTIFPASFFFMDTWYINAISELRQLFFTSWLDLVSKFTGAFALQYRLYTILNAVNAAKREAKRSIRHRPSQIATTPVKSRFTRMLDFILLVWGASVLCLHVHAAVTSNVHHNTGCLLEMRPWGSTKYACAALEVSCSRWHTTGNRNKLESAIKSVNPAFVQILIVSNCAALEMPPAVQSLHSLLMMKLYNSTIVAWEHDAALTTAHHPLMQNLYVARVNMSAMPPGLLSSDFPKTIWGILFCLCNVTDFPDTIAEAWVGVFLLGVEGNPALVDIPQSILQLPRLDILGLRYNSIETVPDQALANMSLLFFDVAGNPLVRLPDSVGRLDAFQFLDIRLTRVANIPPSWSHMAPFKSSRPLLLEAGNTPLCETGNVTDVPWLTLDCTPVPHGSIVYGYPIASEDAWRRTNQ